VLQEIKGVSARKVDHIAREGGLDLVTGMGHIDIQAEEPLHPVGTIAPHGTMKEDVRSVGTEGNVSELEGPPARLPDAGKAHELTVQEMIAPRLASGIKDELHGIRFSILIQCRTRRGSFERCVTKNTRRSRTSSSPLSYICFKFSDEFDDHNSGAILVEPRFKI
jgi:hypothetical protein